MSTHRDDDIEFDFFEEESQPTRERPFRGRRRGGGDGPRPPVHPPTGAVALTRLVGLVAIGIVVVVGLVFWVGACQGKSRHDEYASYMDSVRTVAQSSAKVGTQFAAKLGTTGLKLAELETSLEQWSQQQQQLVDQAQQIHPPGPLRATHQRVLDTLQLRAIALAGLANQLAQAKATTAASTEAQQLADQAQLLTASDIVWTNLYKTPATQILKNLGITGVVAPPSQFVKNPDTVSARSFSIVWQRLQPSSAANVTGLHGSSLVSTKAVGGGRSTTLSQTNPTTIYVAADLALQVTVENSGNFPEVDVPVTLKVIVGGKTLISKKETISGMRPTEQQSVSFTNLQLTADAFGHDASVQVTVAGVPGETKLDNNKATYPVFFSLSQP